MKTRLLRKVRRKWAILDLIRNKYKHLGKEGRMRKALLVREEVWYNS